jgi:iron complex transport system ATP-binding protein
LDTDFETAELLNIPVTSEAPFSPITEKTRKTNLDMINKASTVVVTSVPFGNGNVQNLEAAMGALKKGIPVFVIDEVPIERRDFTKGQATALFEGLKSMGAVFVKNQDELLHMLNVSEEKLKIAKEVQLNIAEHLKAKPSSQETPIIHANEMEKKND